jgi:RNA methyltransferase, TrmH family
MHDLEQIVSRENHRLVRSRKVRDGKLRDLIFIEGRRLTVEALRSGINVREVLVDDDFADDELLTLAISRAGSAARLPSRIFRSVAATETSQGIILLADRPADGLHVIAERITKADSRLPIVLFLHEVNNPSNLGAILRTAEAAGVAGVVTSRNSADVYSPKALRSAMGASLRLPIGQDALLENVTKWAGEINLTVAATAVVHGTSYVEFDWHTPRLLIFGSEAHGLSEGLLSGVRDRVHIPMENGVESLNLAVSAGILLFEARRQIG